MTITDIIILIVILSAAALAVYSIRKNKAKGGCCGDCGRCKACNNQEKTKQ